MPEIKSSVFKRMDPDKLFAVARMDIVERAGLLLYQPPELIFGGDDHIGWYQQVI